MHFSVAHYLTAEGQDPYQEWFNALKDNVAKIAIQRRLNKLEDGLLGDCESVGEGVSELRLHLGPGYRVYFALDGKTVHLILGGGTKRRQVSDIKSAKARWSDYQARNTRAS